MKAKLKYLYNPELEDLSNYQPEDSRNFCVLFRALVGPSESDGEESFDIQVCTPSWLQSNLKQHDIIQGRHFIIVLEYNYDRISEKIKQLTEACDGPDWKCIAKKLSCIGYWEFENYSQ